MHSWGPHYTRVGLPFINCGVTIDKSQQEAVNEVFDLNIYPWMS